MLHTSEDSYLKWHFGTFLRIIRILGILAAALLPGIYIALTLFHTEMIPSELLVAIAQSREKVPFPGVIEVLLMEVSFELIREAGIRVPGVIGNTLGIVGALILGQASVQAGIVSPILVIVVSITGIGNFTIPNYSLTFAIRIIRFVFIFLGSIMGFFGISVGLLIFTGIVCSMKSFGVPYLSPVAPKSKTSTDLIIRQPLFNQKERPDILNPLDKTRTGKTVRGWVKKGR
jgi:spore germination protein KA